RGTVFGPGIAEGLDTAAGGDVATVAVRERGLGVVVADAVGRRPRVGVDAGEAVLAAPRVAAVAHRCLPVAAALRELVAGLDAERVAAQVEARAVGVGLLVLAGPAA